MLLVKLDKSSSSIWQSVWLTAIGYVEFIKENELSFEISFIWKLGIVKV